MIGAVEWHEWHPIPAKPNLMLCPSLEEPSIAMFASSGVPMAEATMSELPAPSLSNTDA